MTSAGLLAPAGLPTRVGRALRRSGTGWWVALIPTPWFLLTDCFGPLRPDSGTAGWAGVPGVLLQVLVVGWLAGPLLRVLRGNGRPRAWQPVLVYACSGALRAAALVALAPSTEEFWTALAWLAPSRMLGSAIWLTGSALVVHWAGRVRAQRAELGTEYARLTRTRSRDAQALAAADDELAGVRAATQAALQDIHGRLSPRMSETELRATVAVIEEVVAGLVRPTSHDLATRPTELGTAGVQPLWMRRRQIVPALIRAWPLAAPYQPRLVALLCLPMVLAAELVPEPHLAAIANLVGPVGLAVQLLLLGMARYLLAPRLGRVGGRAGVAVVFASYLVLGVAGLVGLGLARRLDPTAPLEAFLAPVLIAGISGGVAAAALAHSREAAAARGVIARTRWDVRRSRQRLWAQRRRLAMALHGRVQANLTAAALVLSRAADSMAAGGSLDAAVIAQVRQTLTLASWIDQAQPGSPQERLTSIATVWAGVLEVALELRPRAEELLEANRDAADACVEVLREILLNAVRHGGASAADVVIGLDHGSMVCLRVAERRIGPRPPAPSRPPGLGRSLIDSLAVDWAESDAVDGRVTVVLLAGGAAPEVGDAAVRLADVDDLG